MKRKLKNPNGRYQSIPDAAAYFNLGLINARSLFKQAGSIIELGPKLNRVDIVRVEAFIEDKRKEQTGIQN